MKSDFHARKARKEARLQELAEKNRAQSEALFNKSSKMAEAIPFGQPILIGHHSEKRDRSYRNKIAATMDKSVRAEQKAEYFEGRLHSLQENNAISSDDPDALPKLKNKLADLEALQLRMKESNKIVRNKKLSDDEKVAKLIAFDVKLTERSARALLCGDFCGRVGYADYQLSNNSNNMARIRDRIKSLEKITSMAAEEITIHGVRILTNVEENRIQIFFPDTPSSETRTDLKSNGFRWSRQVRAWQRHISTYAVHLAKQIVTKHSQPAPEDTGCTNCGA